MADPEIKPITEFKEPSDEKPNWQDITTFHPTTKPDFLCSRPPYSPLVPEEYIEKLQAWMEEMHHLTSKIIAMASEKRKTRYDAREQLDRTSTKATKCGYGIQIVAKDSL
ncbi:hypothetical protein TNCV_3630651 [Trichonephila clavipes]|nr:hypothetical protein TNCV_3630651 [Trichonephila clavipes]